MNFGELFNKYFDGMYATYVPASATTSWPPIWLPLSESGQTPGQFHYSLRALKKFQDPFINCLCEVVGKA